MLDNVQIENNKNEFLKLVESIEREGIDKETLIKQLTQSDFFTAPASTIYHGAHEGGLCEHCLNVYYNLLNLVQSKGITAYSDDTLKIVALFHDFSKMNHYEKYYQNKKVYNPNGTKSDNAGNFEWQSVEAFKTRDSVDRFLFGSHGQTALYMTQRFIPLSTEEACAILNHMGGCDGEVPDLSSIYNRYNLVLLLHTADLLATFVDERLDR